MLSPRSRALAWAFYIVILAAVAASVVFLVLALDAPAPTGAFGFRGFSSIYALAFGTVGLLIALRRPDHPIGWMLLASGGLLGAGQQVALQYAMWTLLGDGAGPGSELAAWFQDWIWLPQLAALGVALALIPDGRLPSPRWRPLPWVMSIAAAVAVGARILTPGPIDSFREVRNPFGLDGARDALGVVYTVGLAVMLGTLLAASVSLALRRRHARGEERTQVRWVAFGGLVATFAFLVYSIAYWSLGTGPTVDLLEVAFVLAVTGFAVALGIAVLRFRLFDIDLVVSKAVVFGVLATFITGVYVAIVVGVGTLVGSRGDALLSALAAALVAVAFQPVRRRARRLADRLVYGERATPYEVLSEFAQRVAGAYGAEDVLERMARILHEGTGATRAEVWLRVGPRLELVAAWPEADGAPEPVALDGDADPEIASASLTAPVRHQGAMLGALAIAKSPTDPLTSTEERLVTDLAHQAGLVLRNAALIADLRASRQRLVAAQDEERRRLERNLHDGAQQQLVALSVKLGLLKRAAGDELPDAADALIEQLKADSQEALETLRDLARGIFPPLLADRGLGAALEAHARKAPLPVEVRAHGLGRYPQPVEAAVYFCCLEALQNVAKHARASRAMVRVAEEDGALAFEVSDDGVGFEPEDVSEGTGLQGIRDRLAALDGSLEVRSAAGAGTALVGRIPLPR